MEQAERIGQTLLVRNVIGPGFYLCSVVVNLPLIFMAIAGLKHLRSIEKPTNNPMNSRLPNKPKCLHSRSIQACLCHLNRSRSDDHPRPLVRISRPFYHADLPRAPNGISPSNSRHGFATMQRPCIVDSLRGIQDIVIGDEEIGLQRVLSRKDQPSSHPKVYRCKGDNFVKHGAWLETSVSEYTHLADEVG